MKSRLSNIHQDIVFEEILPRLPVKSLLRFSCVSKSWCSSISDAKFSLKTRKRRIAVLAEEYGPLSSRVLYDIDSKSTSEELQYLPFLEKKPHRLCLQKVRLLCSYEGLLLLNDSENFFLFNPMTRKFEKVLSNPKSSLFVTCTCAGICYDSSTQDYKVVVGVYYHLSCFGGPQMYFSSLRSKIWKETKFPRAARFSGCGPVIDEKMHWLAYEGEEIDRFRGPDLIFCFDTVKDEFLEVPTPDPRYGIKNDIVGLVELEGCLALARWERVGGSFKNGVMELLLMEKYGVKDSWTVMFCFKNLFGWNPQSLEILGFNDDRELLVQSPQQHHAIIAFSTEYETYRDVFVLEGIFCGVVTYIESLTCPPASLTE